MLVGRIDGSVLHGGVLWRQRVMGDTAAAAAAGARWTQTHRHVRVAGAVARHGRQLLGFLHCDTYMRCAVQIKPTNQQLLLFFNFNFIFGLGRCTPEEGKINEEN